MKTEIDVLKIQMEEVRGNFLNRNIYDLEKQNFARNTDINNVMQKIEERARKNFVEDALKEIMEDVGMLER